MTQLDDQGTRPRRARWAERLAVTGVYLALAGIVLAILFAILAGAWSDAVCGGIQSSILNVMPGMAFYALGLGLLCGMAAIALRPSEWRSGASAASLSVVGFLVAFVAIVPFMWRSCNYGS